MALSLQMFKKRDFLLQTVTPNGALVCIKQKCEDHLYRVQRIEVRFYHSHNFICPNIQPTICIHPKVEFYFYCLLENK